MKTSDQSNDARRQHGVSKMETNEHVGISTAWFQHATLRQILMNDLLFLGLMLGFFGLSALYVQFCGRL